MKMREMSIRTGMITILCWMVLQSFGAVEQDVKARLNQMPKVHPRLLFTQRMVAQLKSNAGKQDGKVLAKRVLADSDDILKEPPLGRQLTGRRLLEISRKILFRINNLAVAYILTGNKAYADRAIAEMMNAAAYEDWNPKHFLDVAELTLGMAIGYDTFYKYLSPEQKKKIEGAIIDKGIKPSFEKKYSGWIKVRSNWNAVCHTGMLAGALAVVEKVPDLAEKTIVRAVQYLPLSMKEGYYPNGAYPEGPMYWKYGTDYTTMALALLQSSFGTDFLLSKSPGFNHTCLYLMHITGPTGIPFNYGDCSPYLNVSFAVIWLSYYFKHPEWFVLIERKVQTAYCTKKGWDTLLPLSLPFLATSKKRVVSPQEKSYFSTNKCNVPIASMRTGWDSDDAWFAMIAGRPGRNHGHMDCGNFVYDCNGVRWAVDLPAEKYNRIEQMKIKLWNLRQDSDRWKLFRLGSEGHNILMVNKQPQNVNGKGKITSATPRLIVADITPAYTGIAKRVCRKAELLPRKVLRVTDELDGVKPDDLVSWQILTYATPGIQKDGSILLKSKGKAMRLTKNVTDSWEVISCENPGTGYESTNPGLSQIRFKIKASTSGKVNLVVHFTPVTN